MERSKPNPAECWLTRQQAADLLGITANHFDRAYRDQLGDDEIFREPAGRHRVLFRGRAVCRIYSERLVAAAESSRENQRNEDDLPLDGDDVPAKDYREAAARLKLAQAKREEIKLEQDRKAFMPVDQAKKSLLRFASNIRAAGDALARQFGVDAHEILNEHLDEAERVVLTEFGSIEDDDGVTETGDLEEDGD